MADKRRNIIIITTEPKESKIKIGDKELPVLKFQATAKGTDKKAEFECWVQTMFDYIKQGYTGQIEIDIEYDHTSKESGGVTYQHRKITQIYKDNKPLYEKKPYSGGFRGKSAEEIASIERQTFSLITERLWIADKLKDTDTEIKQLRILLKKKLV